MANRIDALLQWLENKGGRGLVATLVATLLLVLAHLYVTPGKGLTNEGSQYAQLSLHPLDIATPQPQQTRILTPLLAHYAYFLPLFPSQDFVLLTDLIGIVFLGVLYAGTRSQGLSPITATMGAAIMAFSAPILLPIYFPGSIEVTSYLFVFLAMYTVRNNLVWPWMLASALLNHENTLFALPWFLFFYHLRNDRKVLRTLGAIPLVVLSALPWYWVTQAVSSHGGVTSSFAFLLNAPPPKEMFRLVALNFYHGSFQAFKLFWALPAYAIVIHLKERNFSEILLYVTIVLCCVAQVCVSSEVTRLLASAFPVIWLGFVTLARSIETALFHKVMAHLFVINLLVPQFYLGKDKPIRLYSVPEAWALRKFFG